MSGLPTFQVLLDDGTSTFPYDITSFCRLTEGMTITRGRQDELSTVTPGQLSLTLDNTDGRFTLGSTLIASPSPIVTDRMIRVKETANATVFTRFTGYVQAWPVSFPTGGDEFALVQITATDAQARAERQPLLSVIEQEILEDSPVAYYTLGEPAGAKSAADSSGAQAQQFAMAGTGSSVAFGTAMGPGTDSLTAASFAGGQYLTTTMTASCATIEFWFSTTSVSVDLIGGNVFTGTVTTAFGINSTGHIQVGTQVGPIVNDGATHHLMFMANGGASTLYIDGTLVSGSFAAGVGGPPAPLILGANPVGFGNAFVGAVSHVALYSTVLSGARASAHATAGSTGFAGESGTARLTRTASYANLPVGTLDTSLTNVAFEDITGHTVAAELQTVADAEFGLVFIDGTGSLRFHNRNKAAGKTAPDVTIDANLLAEDTSFQYDNQGVLNYFEVTAAGTSVTQTVRAIASEATHGRYTGSATYLVQTDTEALNRGNWIVNNHDEPNVRAGTLKFDLLTATAAQQAAFLGAEANTWIRVTGLPAQTPGGTTADLIVQGFTEGTALTDWTLTFNVSARALYAAWILGDSTYGVLGTTTIPYV